MSVTYLAHTRFFDPDVDLRPGTFRPWQGRGLVRTQGDWRDRPYWERDAGGLFEGGGTDPGASGTVAGLPTVSGGSPSSFTVSISKVTYYKIEVVSPAGAVLISSVPFLAEGQGLELELDRASTLRFRVAGTYASLSSLVRPNYILLRDRWGLVMGRFQIQKRRPVRDGVALFVEFVCQDALSQLSREPVVRYETLVDGAPGALPVATIVGELLALQQQSPALSLGIIDAVVGAQEVTFSTQDVSVLGALSDLRESLPRATAGHFYVDAANRLHWRVSVGTTGESLNALAVTGLRYEVNHDEQVTRLYMYGEGQDARTRLKLTDAGEAEEYIQDATAVSSYGVIPGVRVESRITDATTLLAVARRVLEEFKEPHVRVSVDVLDLAKADRARAAVNDIYLGSTYGLTDSGLGISTTVVVRRISVDLSNPIPIAVELENRRAGLDELLGKLLKGQTRPVDVNDDGSRYPNIARQYEGDEEIPGHRYRNGDWKYDTADDAAFMFYRDSNDGGAGPYGNVPLDSPWTRVARWVDLGSVVKWVQIATVHDDYLDCLEWDPVTEATGAAIKASKPIIYQLTLNPDAEFSTTYAADQIVLIARAATNVAVGGSYLEWVELGIGQGAFALKSAEDKTALAAILNNGELGYTTGATKRGYWKLNDVTICITGLE